MKAFGDRLREAREARGVSVRAVATSTRITERYLHALERSDLEALPGGVFDKGYIKSYAQFLDIDPKPLLESYGIEERGRGTTRTRAAPCGTRRIRGATLLFECVERCEQVGRGP